MDELAKRIKASLENLNSEPWFPELTADLAARGWERLHHDIGLPPDSYSTERVLSRSLSAPREIIASLKTCPSICAKAPPISIEALTAECAVQYQKQGVTFYSPNEILSTTVLSCLEDALATINQVPSLMRTVAVLVRSLHVIKPEDGDHDVSFSEPDIPFSIFVSVPQERITNDALRVAEAIVHEAMHLQLTLIEQVAALTASMSKKYYSPWRKEVRNAQGIIHALYVFTVIDKFLAHGSVNIPEGELAAHVRKRRNEINIQIIDTDSFEATSELTILGSEFVGLIYSSRFSSRSARTFRALVNSSSTS